MPYNGTGTYNPVASPDFPAVPATTIRSSQYNSQIQDMASALSLSLTRDGQSVATGDIPLGNHGITGLRAAAARGEAPNAGQIQDGTLHLLTGLVGVDAITALAPLDLTAYAVGQRIVFIPVGANTGDVTLNIGGLGARSVTADGTAQLPAGTLKAGVVFEAWYDGATWQLGGLASMLNAIQAQIDALKAETPYTGTPIGGYITPFSPPPTNNSHFRYVLCTAGQTGAGGYNEGVLTSETVTGAFPTNQATAVVSLAGSPFNGETIHLINTEGRFVGAGSLEAFLNDALQNIIGQVSGINFYGSPAGSGALTVAVSGTPLSGGTTTAANYGVVTVDLSKGTGARTDIVTRPRSHVLPHYRRIL